MWLLNLPNLDASPAGPHSCLYQWPACRHPSSTPPPNQQAGLLGDAGEGTVNRSCSTCFSACVWKCLVPLTLVPVSLQSQVRLPPGQTLQSLYLVEHPFTSMWPQEREEISGDDMFLWHHGLEYEKSALRLLTAKTVNHIKLANIATLACKLSTIMTLLWIHQN